LAAGKTMGKTEPSIRRDSLSFAKTGLDDLGFWLVGKHLDVTRKTQ
jgi:hypothetical protein